MQSDKAPFNFNSFLRSRKRRDLNIWNRSEKEDEMFVSEPKSRRVFDLKKKDAIHISLKYAPFFIAFWAVLYLSIVRSQVDRLPKPLYRVDEHINPESFIAERAEITLIGLTSIGPRVVGSVANEVTVLKFLLNEIEKIRTESSDYFKFEIDIQEATGNYVHWSMINMYQSIQNVIVKLSAKNSSSGNYVLINSHYDTVPSSPGAGDDGSMVAIMLEVMRVICKSKGPLEHPIVFLFNGAEENPLQASHAFITQHKWAKNCKALINLDAAGNGGREILFQSGPQHSWLMKYYRQVPHPFATCSAEEIFQAGLIPSDTDFRIFRDFGGVPGYDMAFISNGYVYHTEHDKINVLSKGSLQHTGDNVLTLAKCLANAQELNDIMQHSDGHVVFFDFLGNFIIFYTESVGIIINISVCVIAIIAIGISLYTMAADSAISLKSIFSSFGASFAVQVVALAVGGGLALLNALFMDAIGSAMSWYSQKWMFMGLYFCPLFFGMGMLPACYLEKSRKDRLFLGFRIQLLMHSHCLFLVAVTIFLTYFRIRSAYLFMMAVLFYTLALIIHLTAKCYRSVYRFGLIMMVCQILPFLYYTSLTHIIYDAMVPMAGRSGLSSNPEIFMCGIAIFVTILFAGFIIPLLLFFRKVRVLFSMFLIVTFLFIIIALTPLGFPYRAKTASQRYALIHAHRIIHDADKTTRVKESGIYVFPQDRNVKILNENTKSIGQKHLVSDYCAKEMLCGMPFYNHRWYKARDFSFWIPVEEDPYIPEEAPMLVLLSSNQLVDPFQINYEFELNGPDHMTIFIDLTDQGRIIDWSFNETMIRENWQPPYFIYFSWGKTGRPLKFTILVEKTLKTLGKPILEIGIGGHWTHAEKMRPKKYQEFVNSLPDYSTLTDWVATYESWTF
ncbi:endoplasmic reticulum metallopeptidase 1 [Glossina fuscipes]|uniref:FXNA-like protease n=1 Tax=Glossina fuscipes TaxID=7396 RepID=A0A9C5ZAP3_9MUSC|nr:endoplasmic reticulum metallopeptidase 1 [Glossina fuscipes]